MYLYYVLVLCTMYFVTVLSSFSHIRINLKSIYCTVIEYCEEYMSDIASWFTPQRQ